MQTLYSHSMCLRVGWFLGLLGLLTIVMFVSHSPLVHAPNTTLPMPVQKNEYVAPLRIEPTLLWNTFLGGRENDYGIGE